MAFTHRSSLVFIGVHWSSFTFVTTANQTLQPTKHRRDLVDLHDIPVGPLGNPLAEDRAPISNEQLGTIVTPCLGICCPIANHRDGTAPIALERSDLISFLTWQHLREGVLWADPCELGDDGLIRGDRRR